MSTKDINAIVVLGLIALALFAGYCIGREKGWDDCWDAHKGYIIPALQAEGNWPADTWIDGKLCY